MTGAVRRFIAFSFFLWRRFCCTPFLLYFRKPPWQKQLGGFCCLPRQSVACHHTPPCVKPAPQKRTCLQRDNGCLLFGRKRRHSPAKPKNDQNTIEKNKALVAPPCHQKRSQKSGCRRVFGRLLAHVDSVPVVGQRRNRLAHLAVLDAGRSTGVCGFGACFPKSGVDCSVSFFHFWYRQLNRSQTPPCPRCPTMYLARAARLAPRRAARFFGACSRGELAAAVVPKKVC